MLYIRMQLFGVHTDLYTLGPGDGGNVHLPISYPSTVDNITEM